MDPSTDVLIASALATTGWLYTARRARTLSKKQHTINAILQSNFNERFLNSRAEISPHLRPENAQTTFSGVGTKT